MRAPAFTDIAPRHSELHITSSGITTNAMKEQLFAGRLAGVAAPQVLVASDGWQRFAADQSVSRAQKVTHSLETAATKWWTRRWLRFAFGSEAHIRSRRLGQLTTEQFEEALAETDALVLPGGNTFLLAGALLNHRETLGKTKTPIIGASAGSIALGKELWPAKLPPADIVPTSLDCGVAVLQANVAAHIRDTSPHGSFDLPWFSSLAGQTMCRFIQTDPALLATFISLENVRRAAKEEQSAIAYDPQSTDIPTISLHETTSAMVTDGALWFSPDSPSPLQ